MLVVVTRSRVICWSGVGRITVVFAVRIVGHFFFNYFDSEIFLLNLNNLILFSSQIWETVGNNLFSFN